MLFTFWHGILLGQVSVLLFAAFIIRLVFLQDPQQTQKHSLNKQSQKRKLSKQQQQQPSTASSQDTTSSILNKLAYDIATHPQESADWLNVLLAHTISAYRKSLSTPSSESCTSANIFLEQALNANQPTNPEKQAFISLDYINVTQVDFGESFPNLSSVRVRPSEENGQVRIEAELDYSDNISLLIDTNVLVNFPTPKFAIVPISLGVSLVGFSATVSAEICSLASSPSTSSSPISPSHPPTHPSLHSSSTPHLPPPPQLRICIHPDFDIHLTSTSLIGAKAKLQDIPKVEQLVISRIRAWIIDKYVWPSKIGVNLPRLFVSQQQRFKSHPSSFSAGLDDINKNNLSSQNNTGGSNESDEDDQDLLNWVDNSEYDQEFNSLMSELQNDFDSIHNEKSKLLSPNSSQRLPGEFYHRLSSPTITPSPPPPLRNDNSNNKYPTPSTLTSPPTPSTPAPHPNQNLRKRPTYATTIPSSSSINTTTTPTTNPKSTKSTTTTTTTSTSQR